MTFLMEWKVAVFPKGWYSKIEII